MMTLGRRVAQAREDAGMTQDGLGKAVDLERTAISRLESGDRKLNVPELVRIATALKRPLAFFVAEPIPSVLSRRQEKSDSHDSTHHLELELEQFAADVRMLLTRDLLTAATERLTIETPRDHSAAEAAASQVRKLAGLDSGPIDDLGQMVEDLGLYVLGVPFGENGPDGACVEVEADSTAVGAAVINADAPSGRRRMTVAHELGHWVFGDAYDAKATPHAEQMIRSFAIHLLAPRAGVTGAWRERASWSVRDRALFIAADFRISWSAAISQLRNLGLVDYEEYGALSRAEPRLGDYLRLRLTWPNETNGLTLSRGFVAAVLSGYATRRVTESRAIELLRGTVTRDELPERPEFSREDLRRSFQGHSA